MGQYDNVVLNGLLHDDGAENPGGVAENAYILRQSDILTEQEPSPSTTPESLLTITSAHVMKTGKSPILAEPVYEKSDFQSDLEGEIYSHLFNPKLTLFIAQPTLKSMGGLSVLKNARMRVLFRRPGQTSDFYQIGSKFMAAKIESGSIKFGKGPSGEPGVMFVVSAHSTQPVFNYTAALPVTGV